MSRVTVRVPEVLDEYIDFLKKENGYQSKSEVYRDIVRDKMEDDIKKGLYKK